MSEKCNENPNIDNFYFHKQKNMWFNKCKNGVNEKVKCLLCEKNIRRNSLANHKKRYHIKVVEAEDNDIDKDNIINNSIVNRTLIVGPWFCVKTYLVMNKFLLSECDNPDDK